MKTVRRQEPFSNVVRMDGSPVRIRSGNQTVYSPDPVNDAILGELLGNTAKAVNEPVCEKRQASVDKSRKMEFSVNIDKDKLKRIGLAVGSFVMFCGLLKVGVPFVTNKLSRPISQHQAVNASSSAAMRLPAMPAFQPEQDATARRMQKLEKQIGHLETVITQVADVAAAKQPPVQPLPHESHRARRVTVVRREAPRVKRGVVAPKPVQVKPVIRKQSEAAPVIIHTDQPQEEKLF